MIHPRLVPLPAQTDQKTIGLLAPPETRWMKAGFVRLLSGESIGLHNTGAGEEIILPITGAGVLRCPELEPIPLSPGSMIYNPPGLEHDVMNSGGEDLVYLYIVTKKPTMKG